MTSEEIDTSNPAKTTNFNNLLSEQTKMIDNSYSFLDTTFPESAIIVPSTTRNFQVSVIIKQKASRNGIITFLESLEPGTNS